MSTYYHNQRFAEQRADEIREQTALEAEEHLKNFPDWKEKLDNCPCTREEIEQNSEFESSNSIESFIDEYYHPGADTVYRSTEATEIPSTVNPNLSPLQAGQQCAYDEDGNLITHGEAAGTPDAFNPNVTDLFSYEHTDADVTPAEIFDLERYHQSWTPNNGDNCPINRGEELELEDVLENSSFENEPTETLLDEHSELDNSEVSPVSQSLEHSTDTEYTTDTFSTPSFESSSSYEGYFSTENDYSYEADYAGEF